jgi:hypothetical protein
VSRFQDPRISYNEQSDYRGRERYHAERHSSHHPDSLPASRITNKAITGDENATMQKDIRVITRTRCQHMNQNPCAHWRIFRSDLVDLVG